MISRNTALIAGGAFVLLLAAAGSLVFVERDAAAVFVWERWRAAPVALALVEEDADLLLEIGAYYYGGGAYDLARAEEAYLRAARRAGDDRKKAQAFYQLARISFVEGNSSQALTDINRALELDPENRRALYIRGLIHGYAGNAERAVEDFSEFAQWAPSEWAGYNDLAWVLLKAERYEEARRAVHRAFLYAPRARENPWLWNSLGVAELNLGDYAAARQAFLEAEHYAKRLSENDWQRAYPGNNPAQAAGGLAAFRAAIGENLRRAREATR